jgi:hypothetical protein
MGFCASLGINALALQAKAHSHATDNDHHTTKHNKALDTQQTRIRKQLAHTTNNTRPNATHTKQTTKRKIVKYRKHKPQDNA